MPDSQWRVVAVDLAKVHSAPVEGVLWTTLGWGDFVKVNRPPAAGDAFVEVEVMRPVGEDGEDVSRVAATGYIRASKSIKATEICRAPTELAILKVNFIDVQQGDGCVVETPSGQVMLIDGGENQMFARYVAARFRSRHTTKANRQKVRYVVVSHGDADHFKGLTKIFKSETTGNIKDRQRVFIAPQSVFHNGLAKRPGKRADGSNRAATEMFGDTITQGGATLITELVDDLRRVPDSDLNVDFVEWKKALEAWNPAEVRRLGAGDTRAFADLRHEGVKIEVLGPLTDSVTHDGNQIEALRFLGEPPEGPYVDGQPRTFSGASDSHTINGHSIILRIVYGNVSFLLAGDLNEQAEATLLEHHKAGTQSIAAHVLKVPHHGSADFSPPFLDAVGAVVSVVSSGDDSKEFIHPRANLMAALGRASRRRGSTIFVTELVAFFKYEGRMERVKPDKDEEKSFFAFSRSAYGMVKTRTDGHRLLVYTNSGLARLKEAYAFEIGADGAATPVSVRAV